MTGSVVITHPDVHLPPASLTMLQGRIGCLSGVEGRHLVGIITDHDVLWALGQDGTEIRS